MTPVLFIYSTGRCCTVVQQHMLGAAPADGVISSQNFGFAMEKGFVLFSNAKRLLFARGSALPDTIERTVARVHKAEGATGVNRRG